MHARPTRPEPQLPDRSGANPLALPAVPPRAPATHLARDRAVVALFVLALLLPLGGAIVKRGNDVTAFENRRAEPWPGTPASSAALRNWPTALGAAFADRFGGRDALVRFHHETVARVFGVSPVPKRVLIGRDRWLYFLGEDGLALDRDFRGVLPYPADEPARVATELARRQDALARRGIAYVVMIVPDKATVYPEQLPRWVRPSPSTRLDRLYAELARHPEVTALDLRPALAAAKAREQVYFRSDSHWNLLGATIGYQELARALQAALPNFPALVPARPAYVPGIDVYSGDLAQMLGLPRSFAEADLAPMSKLLAAFALRCPPGTKSELPPQESGAAKVAPPVGNRSDLRVDACGAPAYPAAVVFRDSMAIPLVPLLSENFRRVVYASSRRLDLELIDRERPDVVIEELVERTIHEPAAMPM